MAVAASVILLDLRCMLLIGTVARLATYAASGAALIRLRNSRTSAAAYFEAPQGVAIALLVTGLSVALILAVTWQAIEAVAA